MRDEERQRCEQERRSVTAHVVVATSKQYPRKHVDDVLALFSSRVFRDLGVMINGKKVAVVLPASNAEHTLEKTAELIDRSLIDHVIVIDDCSTDNTVKVAERLSVALHGCSRYSVLSLFAPELRYNGSVQSLRFAPEDAAEGDGVEVDAQVEALPKRWKATVPPP